MGNNPVNKKLIPQK